jgi:thiosulfate sulfurtransferase
VSFKQIDVQACRELIKDTHVTVLDIRDPYSYEIGHIENALHVEDIDVDKFVAEQPKDRPLLIYCFHGMSSQGAAEFFVAQGFTEVYSLDGGFAAWS